MRACEQGEGNRATYAKLRIYFVKSLASWTQISYNNEKLGKKMSFILRRSAVISDALPGARRECAMGEPEI